MRWIDHLPEIARNEQETLASDFTVPTLSEFEMAALDARLGRSRAVYMESASKAFFKVLHRALGIA